MTRKWMNSTTIPGYNTWKGLFARCYNKSSDNYKNYGARGIKVCKRWFSYDNFIIDMGEKPEGMTLDRIDNDGDYCPENCRWATNKEQHNNTRRSVNIEHNGEVKTIGEWCDFFNVSDTERQRIYKRYSAHGATEFEELFCKNLLSFRTAKRVNQCQICNRKSSIKWRKAGKLCNTCYHRALRWSSKTGNSIEMFHEWKGKFRDE